MEQKDEGYFAYYAKIDKVYRKLCALEVAEYCFTPNEIVVLMFLATIPVMTARRISLISAIFPRGLWRNPWRHYAREAI